MAMMRSATLVAPFDIQVEEVEKPEIGSDLDTVIIKLVSIGICGSNLHWWYGGGSATGVMGFPMPGAGAHEHAGIVEEVGPDVTLVKTGDRVVVDAFHSKSCGSCVYCASGLFIHCTNPRDLNTGYTDYLKMTEKGLHLIPDNIETEVAAVVEPCSCSISGIRRAGLIGGETVVVLGAGVLGLAAAAAAKAMGASRVIITAKHDSQAALATQFGADAVVRSSEPDTVERILAHTSGKEVDLIVETVGGHAPTLDQAIDLVRFGGKIVVLGLWDELVPVDSWKAILKDVTMIWSLTYGMINNKTDFELCLEWMSSGKLPAQDLVTHVMPLSDIKAAFELAADKTKGVVKVCIKP